jgi:acyl-coenzyme A thioesterase PaaI-like protein
MPAGLAVSEQELQQLLDTVAFTRHNGFRLHSITDGGCTLHVPFQPAIERPGGIVSGQVYMVVADVAMWLAIKTRLGLADGSVTAELNTAFLYGARREDFWCSASILKLGKRSVFGVAECHNADGRRLTHHTITYARLRSP